ncbi:hypothetical protein [Jannaschia sp. R86511]|uniref:hypothetical protein n=1 Tax=Jannaschia sp. R86511 TaxID=3093853 RepID=UPI0036D30673
MGDTQKPGQHPVVALGGLDRQVVQVEGDPGVGHAVVGQDEGPFHLLGVELGEQLVDGGRGADVGLHRWTAVEAVRGQHPDVAVRVVRAPGERHGGSL